MCTYSHTNTHTCSLTKNKRDCHNGTVEGQRDKESFDLHLEKKWRNLLGGGREWPFKIEGDGNTEGDSQRPVKTLYSCREFKFSTSRLYSP